MSVLIDTNVLVYADDSAEPGKRDLAAELIAALIARGDPVVTVQVLAEYYVTLTRKLSPALPPEDAERRVERIASAMPVLETTYLAVREALRGARRYGMHYYDGQVWATARLSGISTILTEDMPSCPEIEGVRFVDPFFAGGPVGEILATLG